MIYLTETTWEYNKTRVFQRLRIMPDTTSYAYADEIFNGLVHIAQEAMEMTHCYSLRPNNLNLDSPEIDKCEKLAVCFSSCSDEIGGVIDEMIQRGDYLEGYILNDLANEVLFNASNQMNRQIAEQLKGQDYHMTSRYSPGENHLGMEHQSTLLNALKEEIPLTAYLTDGFMISPEKSMLYAFGVDQNIPDTSIEHDCGTCSNIHCFFRVVN